MELEDLSTYLYLTRTATPEAQAEEEPEESVWNDLRSNDQTRIESAVGQIEESERPSYRRRLLATVRSLDEGALARVSAGNALAVLGDLRFGLSASFVP